MADELKILEGIYLFALSNSNWLEALELSTRLNLYRKGEKSFYKGHSPLHHIIPYKFKLT